MNTQDPLHDSAAELVDAARAFHDAAGRPRSHDAAPDALASLEEALQVLSGAWYQLAAHASPGLLQRRGWRGSEAQRWPSVDGLSREQEVRLTGTLHDVAAAFARCARTCREKRSTVTPMIARRIAGRAHDQRRDHLSWLESPKPPARRVA